MPMEQQEIYLEKEINLRDYFRIIRKRKYMVYTFFILAVDLVVLYTYTVTPQYMSTAKILIEKGENNPLYTNYGYMQYDYEFIETQIQIIKSTPVARKVVDKLNLVETYDSYFADIKNRITIDSLLASVTGWGKDVYAAAVNLTGIATPTDSVYKIDNPEEESMPKGKKIAMSLNSGLTIEPVPDSKILNVSFTSPNPVLARMIVNSVTEAYIEKTLEMKMESSGYTIKWMTQKADEERERLRKSEIALQEYMKAQDIVTTENRLAMAPQKLNELNTQQTNAETRRKDLEAVYQKVKMLNGNYAAAESMKMIASDPTIQSLRAMILEAEKKINDHSKKYKAMHPVMKSAVADLEALREKRESEIKRVVGIIKNEYELARSTEQNLAHRLAKTKEDAIRLNEKSVQYNLLKREADTNRQLYDALVTKLKEQGISEQVQSIKVWVVEEAITPETPSKPRKKRNILLGIILGLFGGIGFALFLEYLDNTIKYPDDVQERFGVPVLSMVPRANPGKTLIDATNLEASSNSFVESYKTIRTALLLSGAEGPPRKLLVTSMSPEDGKTTTAINLAVAFALAERRTLLVDTDMRRPRIHKIFNFENDEGLSIYLAGVSEDIKARRTDDIENLRIITSGPAPPNPSELLGNSRFTHFLELASQKYDMIIFDSPPVLTVSDSLILSKLVDGTLIVARAGKATNEGIAKGLKVLGDVQANIFGFVLNDVVYKKSNYYYYHQYYDSYYSSDKRKRGSA